MNKKDFVEHLMSKMRSYETKISKLRAQVDAMESEISRTQELLTSVKLIMKEEQTSHAAINFRVKPRRSFYETLALLSLSEAINAIIQESSNPIHVEQVLNKLQRAGNFPRAKNPRNSVSSIIHRGVKEGKYRKVGPNLFTSTSRQSELPLEKK